MIAWFQFLGPDLDVNSLLGHTFMCGQSWWKQLHVKKWTPFKWERTLIIHNTNFNAQHNCKQSLKFEKGDLVRFLLKSGIWLSFEQKSPLFKMLFEKGDVGVDPNFVL